MDYDSCCAVLGIPKNHTPEELKRAYRYKANILHPDRMSSFPESVRDKAELEMKEVNSAYAALSKVKNSFLGNRPSGNLSKDASGKRGAISISVDAVTKEGGRIRVSVFVGK